MVAVWLWPVFDHGFFLQPGAVSFVAWILTPEPDQNQPAKKMLVFKIIWEYGDYHHWYVSVEDEERHSRGSCKGDQKSKRSQRRTLSLSSQSEKELDKKKTKSLQNLVKSNQLNFIPRSQNTIMLAHHLLFLLSLHADEVHTHLSADVPRIQPTCLE